MKTRNDNDNEKTLKADVNKAYAAHDAARQEFLSICISPKDPTKKEVRKAVERQDSTRNSLVLALARFNEYVDQKKTPEKLRSLGAGSKEI